MSLPKYPAYRDSGVPWIAEVPAHWRSQKIKHFASLSGGGTPARDNLAYWNGGIPWVSPKDMRSEVVIGAEESITELGLASSAASLVPPGALLMVVRSGILKHTIPVAINEQPVVLNQDMKAIRPVGVSAKFLLRWVQGLNAQLLLAWSKPGATVESIEHEQLAGAIVPVPPDSEQVAINAFLDRETAKIDALIAEQERLLALLAEKRQATITHAVTRGLSPDAFMKDSSIRWLGQVPAHWDVMPLKRIVAVPITDGPHETPAFVDEGIPFVSAEAVSGGSIDFTKARGYISVADHEKYSGKYRPRLHDIFLVKSGATTGVSAIVESNVEFNIWSPLAVIRCDRRIADPYFVLAALRSRSFQQGLVLHWSYGTQQNIGMGVLGDLPVALPPLHEQKLIAAALAEQGRQHEELSLMGQRAIDLLRERRAALISAAVTGKIDVRTATEVVLA